MPRPQPETPGAGQESVWDYPRPPRVEPVAQRITIRLGGEIIADTRRAVRVLETSHPPVFYVPIADFTPDALAVGAGSSFCEFKGAARYLDVRGGGEVVIPQPGGFYGGWITSSVVGPFKALRS